MPIKPGDYNSARSTLALAGSKSAAKSHLAHKKAGDVPDKHGTSLLDEASDEFKTKDEGLEGNISGVTAAHRNAVRKAATKMGMTSPIA